jgi:hypothetical protein
MVVEGAEWKRRIQVLERELFLYGEAAFDSKWIKSGRGDSNTLSSNSFGYCLARVGDWFKKNGQHYHGRDQLRCGEFLRKKSRYTTDSIKIMVRAVCRLYLFLAPTEKM